MSIVSSSVSSGVMRRVTICAPFLAALSATRMQRLCCRSIKCLKNQIVSPNASEDLYGSTRDRPGAASSAAPSIKTRKHWKSQPFLELSHHAETYPHRYRRRGLADSDRGDPGDGH